MRKLEAPTDDAVEVFELCIGRVKKRALKKRLRRIVPDIRRAASAFEVAGHTRSFFQIPSSTSVRGIVSIEEMTAVYDSRMAKKGAPGRVVYDRLMGAVPHMRCPLCGQRTISTLDHYLPKANYPKLVVTPKNLVPACADCNKVKLARVALTASEQTLHPYFDDIDSMTWLYAEVVEGAPAALKFFTSPPDDSPTVVVARIHQHFMVFRLGPLYASHAAEELQNIKFGLTKVFAAAGEVGVRDHLAREMESRSQVHRNSWQVALYRALAASDWYCRRGFGL